MNIIGKVTFDFRMQDELFAQELYRSWDHFFGEKVERMADMVMSRLDVPSDQLMIEKLDIDLGDIPQVSFYEDFAGLFAGKLEEALLQLLYGASTADTAVRKLSKSLHRFEILAYFLLHGTLPWNTPEEYPDIRMLFQNVLSENREQLKYFLQTYGHYTSLQERLVYQLDDPELEEGVSLLTPEESGFICGYIHLLRFKYKKIEQPKVRETDYRNIVWQIIYAYLLNNKGAYFNKKSFITAIIERLAVRNNLTYDYLLTILTDELEQKGSDFSVPPELYKILQELKSTFIEKHLKGVRADLIKFYKEVNNHLIQQIESSFTVEGRQALITILSEARYSRLFLQQLLEEDILKLVPIVFPNENNFVIEVAGSLDKHKEQGVLNGRVGGEFRLLKWQIIFPLLLDTKGTGFNRKYFVRQVFQEIASHYNLKVLELLNYFCEDTAALSLLSVELRTILTEYRISIQEQENRQSTKRNSTKNNLEFVSAVIRSNQKLDEDVRQHFLSQLSNASFRQEVICSLSEQERFSLAKLVYPQEFDFIKGYVKQLDHLQSKGFLEGRSASAFQTIKWLFILTVWGDLKSSFNRPYFVRRTLEQLAARFNQTYLDLLIYFQQGKRSLSLPPAIGLVLDNLYEKEHDNWIRCVLSHRSENEKLQLIKKLYASHYLFIKKYSLVLDCLQGQKITEGNTFGKFEELKWIVLFTVLFSIDNHSFSKKQFIHHTLQRIASHYNLYLSELLALLKDSLQVFPEKEMKSIAVYMNELYTKYSNQLKVNSENKKIIPIFQENKSKILNYTIMDELKKTQELNTSEGNPVYVSNAGIVLLNPFISHLFRMLDYLGADRKFKSREDQIRSVYLLQYVVFERTDFPEQELVLNKILVGLPLDVAIPKGIELTEKEKESVDAMLKGSMDHWEKLRHSSINTLREAFLKRSGSFTVSQDNFNVLKVEPKPYDMLLDSLPWSYQILAYSWLEKPIRVEWR